MADAIDFTKTQRIVLLIDLNPILHSPNPNHNYITSILTTSKIILSLNSISSSLFSFKFFISSLSPILSASTLQRLLPNHHYSVSLSFNSPSQTLISLSETLNSIVYTQPKYLASNVSHVAGSLLQLAHECDWESDIDDPSGKIRFDFVNIRSNLIVLLSPICRSVKDLTECLCVNVNENLDEYRARFREYFGVVKDVFNSKDIHLCWIHVHSHEDKLEACEIEQGSALIGNEIRKLGWGFCSTDSIILGSALVPFGLMYSNLVVSPKLVDDFGSKKRISGQLSLRIMDVSGKPLECKCCDLELMHINLSSKLRSDVKTCEIGSSKGQNVDFFNTFIGRLNDGTLKLHVTAVQKYIKCNNVDELSSDFFLVQSAVSYKKGKDGLNNLFADRVLELLSRENSMLFDKHAVPTWQIFLSFLYKEGYWALLSLSNSNGDSCMGILKPFTVHSAILLLVSNNHNVIQDSDGANSLANETGSQCNTDSQLENYVHLDDGKRRKMKKHTHRDLTWISFCKAAYEIMDVDLAEVYFANGCKSSKKLKFLKCWMNQAKSNTLSNENMQRGSCQMGRDSVQQNGTDINENLGANYSESDEQLSTHKCFDPSKLQDAATSASCSETFEVFFSNLPMKITHGLESDGVDLKILAERLVSSSIYWLGQKHKTLESHDESFTAQIAEIIKLLLREPKDLKEHKDNTQGFTSEYLVREYELQIFLRLEILQSEYAESIKGFMKMKFVKQICSLLEIIQYLVDGGVHGDVNLYDYVERTLKKRYLQNLGDVVDIIYDRMDLLPFGEEDEVHALMFNSEDSNQSLREKPASKLIQDSISVEDESSNANYNETVHEEHEKEEHDRKLNEARERRERARRFVSFTSRMPDLQRVWAPKQSKAAMKIKPGPKRKKWCKGSYSVVCETPCLTIQNNGERSKPSNPVSKALFQDDR
ncbi:uncharacterized protein [Rutidosis leptorrhynchoides]|uniref:uncharacterized protein n=1 Tax=Rutidosis leptorrhynchoides TaxID=125765 RepID=UPI003A994B6B